LLETVRQPIITPANNYLIDAAQAIVGASVAIKQVKDNYEGRMKRSLEALLTLQGGTMDLGNNASRESRHQELKYNEDIDVFNEGEDVRTVSFADKVTRASCDDLEACPVAFWI
jgi:hypothetical protein